MKNYARFISQNWALLGFGFLCIFWGNFGQSFFIGSYGNVLKEELNLSSQDYGSLYSFATLCCALILFWVGPWIDRWSLKHFFSFVSVGLFIAAIAMYFVADTWQLFFSLVLLRLFGQGLFPHTGSTTMSRNFDTNRGKAISVATSAVPVGEVLLPLFFVLCVTFLDWRTSWLIIAASIPLCVVPLAFYLLNHSRAKQQISSSRKIKPDTSLGRLILFKDKRFWLAVPIIWSGPFFITAIFIHQDFILQDKSWPIEWMAVCFIVYGIAHWLSSIFSGVLVDRFSGTRLFRFYTIPLILSLLVLANFHHQFTLVVTMALLALTAGAASPVVGSMWAEIYGTDNLGAIRSAVGTTYVFSTSISPILFGWLIDRGFGVEILFNTCGSILLLALGLLRFSYTLND